MMHGTIVSARAALRREMVHEHGERAVQQAEEEGAWGGMVLLAILLATVALAGVARYLGLG